MSAKILKMRTPACWVLLAANTVGCAAKIDTATPGYFIPGWDENTRKRLLDLGADLSDKAAQTPEGLAKLVDSEVVRWKKVLASASKDATPPK